MHDRAVVIRAHVVPVGDVLVKVVLHPRLDLVPVDGHERVAVRARLLVPEADGVACLVDRVAGSAARAEVDELLAALAAHRRRAAGTRPVCDPVGVLRRVRRRAQDESVVRVRLPVGDRVGHPTLVGKSRVDVVRDQAVRPSLVGARNDDAGRYEPAGELLLDLSLASDLVRGPEHDVPLEHREPVDLGVLDGAIDKRRAVDQRRPPTRA